MKILSQAPERAQAQDRIDGRREWWSDYVAPRRAPAPERVTPEIPRLHWRDSIDANRDGIVSRADIPYAMLLHLETLACDFETLTGLRPTDAKIGFTLSVEF